MFKNRHVSIPIVTQRWDLGWVIHHRRCHLFLMNINEAGEEKVAFPSNQLCSIRDLQELSSKTLPIQKCSHWSGTDRYSLTEKSGMPIWRYSNCYANEVAGFTEVTNMTVI